MLARASSLHHHPCTPSDLAICYRLQAHVQSHVQPYIATSRRQFRRSLTAAGAAGIADGTVRTHPPA
eukprot:4570859-Pleurochrysis_carterae.AAC.1